MPWLSDPCTLDDLRTMHANGQITPSTYVTLDGVEANYIPLAWLLHLPVPAAPRMQGIPSLQVGDWNTELLRVPTAPRTPGIPWGKIAIGVAALAGVAWAVKRASEDPEPRTIKRIAEEKEAEGALVFADIRGFPRPPITNGRIADVVAYHVDGTVEAIEVENDRSILRSHASGQIEDLSAWAARSRRRSFSVEVVEGGRGGKG